MSINIRQKGQEGEREVARALNSIVESVLTKHGIPLPLKPSVQRNQNQSAVGGSDLTNPFGLAIEVKRQEQISINTWWAQCLKASDEFGGVPILAYRTNGSREWKIVMYVDVPIEYPGSGICHVGKIRAQISWNDFLQWFYQLVDRRVALGLWNPTE